MPRFIAIFAALAIAVMTFMADAAAPSLKGWEAARAPRAAVRPLESGSDMEVATHGEWVYVVVTKPSKVTLITVLGQPLTEVTLPPGSYRFRIAARGIYILRVASSTFRITI